ncbi:MAG: hypothetical protein ACFFG0_30440 [Candidatus Thorarchaeota archaeon]
MVKYCQLNEDMIINAIMIQLGIEKGFAVEFGAGDGFRLSNIRHLVDKGWKIVQLDANNRGNKDVLVEFITAENINEVFRKHGLTDMDLLSIDIDGNDYWVWQFLDDQPKVIVIEWNPNIDGCKAIKYNPKHVFKQNDYYGATWEAYIKLGKIKGYTLVNSNGLNMFFVRNDLITDRVRIFQKKPPKSKRGWPHCKEGEWVDVS